MVVVIVYPNQVESIHISGSDFSGLCELLNQAQKSELVILSNIAVTKLVTVLLESNGLLLMSLFIIAVVQIVLIWVTKPKPQ